MNNQFTIKEESIAWDRDKHGNTVYRNRFFVERLEGTCLVDYGNYTFRTQAEKRIQDLEQWKVSREENYTHEK